jgi:HNH endonuclease
VEATTLRECRHGYFVSADGKVFDSNGKECAQYPNRDGYNRVNLKTASGSYVSAFVHILVLEAFIGPCPEGCEARHLDGTRNNNLENLIWGTHKENMIDVVKHGKSDVILTEDNVKEIRELLAQGRLSQSKIAGMFNISQQQVSRINTGERWKHVSS